MRGFQPGYKTKSQNYADGGMVEGFKLAFGFKPRMRDTPEYQEAMRRQQAEQAAKAPPQMAQAKPAISQYAGNDALKRRMAEADSYANGGMVRGPGTGTSDDVQDEVPEGTYIMPADSTKMIGARGLKNFGQDGKVPVNLSAGEFKMPPEQVHAVGVQALNQIKDATHTPARGFTPGAYQKSQIKNSTDNPVRGFAPGVRQPKEPRMFFAGGGVVTKEPWEKKGFSYQDNNDAIGQNIKDSWNKGNYGEAVGKTVAGTVGIVTTPVIEGAVNAGSGVAGFARGLFGMSESPDAQASATTAPAQTSATTPLAPKVDGTVAANASGSANMAASSTTPVVAPAARQVGDTGAYQHGKGQYSDNPNGMGFAPGFTGQPNAQNMNAADALASRSGGEIRGLAGFGMGQPSQPQNVTAPTVAHSGNDWASRNALRNMGVSANSIMNRPGGASGSVSGGRGRGRAQQQTSDPTGAVAQYNAAVSADLQKQGMQPQGDIAAMRENAAMQRQNISEWGANFRAANSNALEAQRIGIAGEDAAFTRGLRGFDVRSAQRKEGILGQYDKATTPEAREALVNQYPDVFGAKGGKDNFMAVGGGQEWDAQAGSMRNVPQRLVDLRTGKEVGQGAQGSGGAIHENAKANAAKNDTNMTREQKIAALEALGYK